MSVGLAKSVPEGRKANKAEVAEWFEVSVVTVDAWVRRGLPSVQRGSRGVPWVFDLIEVAAWRFGGATPAGTGDDFDPDALMPKERLDWYKGEQEKRKLQTDDGQLIPAGEYERELAFVVKATANWFETLADVLERDTGLSADQVERVQKMADVQRDKLYKMLVETDDVPS